MSTSEKLASVRALLERRQFEQAYNDIQTLKEQQPDDPDVLFLFAVCQRYAGEYQQALDSLARLLEKRPDYGRAYQEQGHVFSQLNLPADAIEAYQQAVSFNPALMASWRELALALRKAGAEEAARQALASFKQLHQQPPQLVSVASLLHEGRLYKAEKLCRQFLQQHPHEPQAMRLLAMIGVELNVFDDAEFLLETCLQIQPGFEQAQLDYIHVLQKRQKFRQAVVQAEKLYENKPQDRTVKLTYANACVAIGQLDQALTLFDELLADNAGLHHVHLARGHALKTQGNAQSAVSAYQTAYENQPDFGDAFWSLANMKTYRFSDRELEQMTLHESAQSTSVYDRFHLCFALGKGYEDRQQYEKSFSFYQRGNELKRQQSRYSAEKNRQQTELQMQYCTESLFLKNRTEQPYSNQSSGCQTSDPIFIVGLPRAGSTLLEQILASHSQVEGTLELPNISALAHRLNGRLRTDEQPRYPANLHELTAQQLTRFGEQYITDTQIHRQQNTAFFIDKMPNNFRHIGLIHLILPNARIIDARRDPMACCFSGFKQLFAEGQEFTYSLEDIGRYYKDYVALMTHWDQVLPGKVLRVNYENVIENLATEVERLLDFCQLEFEPQCLEFHKTKRAVRTASAEQVRQPLYRSGVDQWRHFEPYLESLQKTLNLTE